MNGYITNIEKSALENTNFRTVLYTDTNIQLVLMSLNADEDIGEEIHDVDQFFRVESGSGTVTLNGVTHEITGGSVIVIPVGVKHNIVNTSESSMKLYTIYTPPHHKDGTVHTTKAEAQAADEHFDGTTTE